MKLPLFLGSGLDLNLTIELGTKGVDFTLSWSSSSTTELPAAITGIVVGFFVSGETYRISGRDIELPEVSEV